MGKHDEIGRNTPRGFRSLSADEIALIAGGVDYVDDIIVDGGGGSGGGSGTYYPPTGGDYYNPGPPSGGDGDGDDDEDVAAGTGMPDAAAEGTKEFIEALVSMLEENIDEHGDAIIKMANGDTFQAKELLDALGKTLDIWEAGTLAVDAANGNADIAQVASFFVGLGVGAAAAAAGATPIAIFVAGYAAGQLTEYAINYTIENFNTSWAAAYQQEIHQNPTYTPGMSMLNIILQMFGQNPIGPIAEDDSPPINKPEQPPIFT